MTARHDKSGQRLRQTQTPAPASTDQPPRHTRQVKVSQMFYHRIVKDAHHAAFDQQVEEPVPWIRLRGKWLAQAGFAIDAPITVQVDQGRLVLTVEDSDDR